MSETFFSKLVGVTFEGRQDHISDLLDLIEDQVAPQPHGWPLEVMPEPNNPYDSNAINIKYRGSSLGHLNRELAANLTAQIRQGVLVNVFLREITGNGLDQLFGVNILIEVKR
jgi:single-stranded-DNA-specific exonuclease